MAESLTREGPIDTIESAVGVLRRAGLGALVLSWTGSVPFAFASLVLVDRAANPRTSDGSLALWSLALTVLLVWMNCWRAVFAGSIRRQLSDAAATPRTHGEWIRLLVVQSFAAGTKLLVLPFSAMIVFPLPSVMSFYRNVATLADRQSLDPRATLARARHLAANQPEQSWLLIPLLLFLGLAVMLNVAVIVGGAPQLVRILTGYESTFSRSGIFFVTNSTFPMIVLSATWVLFDPFVQTVYCLRCYQAEARETGEDLRAGVRRLSSALAKPVAALLAALAILAIAPPCHAEMPAGDLERASQRAMQAPEYDWRLPPPPAPVRQTSWIVSLTDRIVASTKSLRDAIGRLIDTFFSWLNERLGGGPSQQPGALPVRGLHWSVYLLLALVVVAGIWMTVRVLQSRREKIDEGMGGEGAAAIRLDAEDLTPDRLPEDQWLALAERALAEQNFRLALRAFYLASLAWMGRSEYITIHPGKTNREYELELRRRLRTLPEARALFSANVMAFERVWYGLHEAAPGEIEDFRGRVGEMKSLLPGARGVAL